MMKNTTCTALLTGLTGLGLLTMSACGSSEGGDDPEVAEVSASSFADGSTMQRLAEQGSIRIGTKLDLSPIGSKNLQGDVEGFDIEIGKMVAAELGISSDDIEWVETVSANREPYLQQKKVDLVIAYYAITPEREEVVTFAGPYLDGGLDILVLEGNPEGITGPEAAGGKKICGQSGSTGPAALRADYPDVQLVEFDTMSKCVDALKQGSVDGVIQANHVLVGAMEKEEGEFELAGTLFDPTDFGIGITKGDIEFCDFVEGVLRDAEEDGSYAEAWEDTVGRAMDESDAPALPEQRPCA
ncbi:glutamate ABC transporter substrate-binding protein [Aeromicrobium sp. YIM 150415]|uniref:glutamate ABC transporter substrate-binding protein n=1 Tax=Aeromicrobium sp. YIM 150415 TaxID=2803912 RepID=UPI001965EE74|nr:glutamate ABC transporter substrate-binding protein [Aeromicrobium sp. YIM 150415]MBM9463403.1 glutamate ABC transporter substrate-binding protein [Aeromicrobium sp. YIM 150415]